MISLTEQKDLMINFIVVVDIKMHLKRAVLFIGFVLLFALVYLHIPSQIFNRSSLRSKYFRFLFTDKFTHSFCWTSPMNVEIMLCVRGRPNYEKDDPFKKENSLIYTILNLVCISEIIVDIGK